MVQIKNVESHFHLIGFCLFVQMLVKVAAMDNSFENSYSDFSLLVSIAIILCCHNLCKVEAELILVLFFRLLVNDSVPNMYKAFCRCFYVNPRTAIEQIDRSMLYDIFIVFHYVLILNYQKMKSLSVW